MAFSVRSSSKASFFDKFSDEEKAKIEREFKMHGVEGCKQFLQQRQSEWKSIPLNVAVIGNSGVGKSSFINAIRRLNADDEDSAQVGVTECTTDIRCYTHPHNQLFKFWDLPGVGTDKFPKYNYLETIKIDRYDFFLLLSASRFTENDTWLSQEIVKRKKNFVFVRTKLGHDIEDDKRAHPKTHNEQRVIAEVRRSSLQHLQQQLDSDKLKVFLVDNFETKKFDFDELEETLIRDFPVHKKEALVLSLGAHSEQMIKLKVKELRGRIVYAGMLSAATALVGIVTIPIDGAIVTSEAKFYFEQLGLDDNSLRQHADLTGADFGQLKDIVSTSFVPDFFSVDSLRALLAHTNAQRGVTKNSVMSAAASLFRCIPVFGSIPALHETSTLLKVVLDKMESVALEIVQCAAKNATFT